MSSRSRPERLRRASVAASAAIGGAAVLAWLCGVAPERAGEERGRAATETRVHAHAHVQVREREARGAAAGEEAAGARGFAEQRAEAGQAIASWGETWARLARERPVEALEWLGASAVEVQGAVAGELEEVFRRAVRQDATGAGNVIAEFGPGTAGAELAAWFALYQAGEDPAKAARWAEGLPYRGAREAALREALLSWAQRDAAAARRFIDEGSGMAGLRERLANDLAALAAR